MASTDENRLASPLRDRDRRCPGFGRRAGRDHPRMRLAAGDCRDAGDDQQRPRSDGQEQLGHPPARQRCRPWRIVALRARRGGARGGPARSHPDPGALPGLRRELPRGQRGRPRDRCRHHGGFARADLDRGHLQHDLDRRRDDRRGGRGRRAGREPPDAPRDRRDPRPRAAQGRPRRRRGSSDSSGWSRRSPSATGFPSRSGGPAAGTCSARTARRPARPTGSRSSTSIPR